MFALSSALCFPARAGSKSPTDDLVDQLVELVGPIASNLGFSGALGLAAAIALKMVGKAIAVVIGLAFVLVQGLAHFGVVTVHWSEVHQKATKLVDSDGDGDFDKDDMRRIGKSVIGALSEVIDPIRGRVACQYRFPTGRQRCSLRAGKFCCMLTLICAHAGRPFHRRILCGIPDGPQDVLACAAPMTSQESCHFRRGMQCHYGSLLRTTPGKLCSYLREHVLYFASSCKNQRA